MKIKEALELDLWQTYDSIIGLDEAGRGPIAGPLVVAGVIFPKGYTHEELYDSKKISEKKRNQLFEEIKQQALYYEILVISEAHIDAVNMYRATQQAMESIVQNATLAS
ncbi:MAG: ribonuclease HII, partial [Erysipelotrichaceae bacterium]